MSHAYARVLAGWVVGSAIACAAGPRHGDGVVKRPSALREAASAPLVQATSTLAATDGRAPELYVQCADAMSCPSAVGMLVVEGEAAQEAERCTATLIGPDRILTASHCLAASERRAGAACPRTWIAFPEAGEAVAEWVACGRVEYAAELVSEDVQDQEHALHQEHAVLQLARAVTRTPLMVDAAPPEAGSIVTVVSVTPHPIYGSAHSLTTRLCRAIDSEPAQEALGGAAANVGWLARCPIERGNSGSPVLDYEGRIRAIVHGGTSLTSAFGVTSSLSR